MSAVKELFDIVKHVFSKFVNRRSLEGTKVPEKKMFANLRYNATVHLVPAIDKAVEDSSEELLLKLNEFERMCPDEFPLLNFQNLNQITLIDLTRAEFVTCEENGAIRLTIKGYEFYQFYKDCFDDDIQPA